jgi:hypothetical protein
MKVRYSFTHAEEYRFLCRDKNDEKRRGEKVKQDEATASS